MITEAAINQSAGDDPTRVQPQELPESHPAYGPNRFGYDPRLWPSA